MVRALFSMNHWRAIRERPYTISSNYLLFTSCCWTEVKAAFHISSLTHLLTFCLKNCRVWWWCLWWGKIIARLLCTWKTLISSLTSSSSLISSQKECLHLLLTGFNISTSWMWIREEFFVYSVKILTFHDFLHSQFRCYSLVCCSRARVFLPSPPTIQ